jgi:sugar lactone lactonase YvrE
MTSNRGMWPVISSTALILTLLGGTLIIGLPARTPSESVPIFKVDPLWPKIPEKILLGAVRGVAVDAQDHIWIHQDPNSIVKDELEAAANPPLAECCIPGPPVMEFDAAGNYLQGWGGLGKGYDWFERVHGIFVDYKGNVWVSGEQGTDNHLLKFTRDGKFLMQIGHKGKSKGSNDTANLNRAADMCVYPKTNELFVADGYGNRRVIVFDADTGAFKRQWGAYGKPPDDSAPQTPGAQGVGSKTFNLLHDVRISNEGLVYVADRHNNRLQVFTIDGKFVKEGFVARDTKSLSGTVFSIAFSADPGQQFVYVMDGANGRIRILNRQRLEVVGSFGRWGPYAGQFMVPHNVATDSKGNLYTGEAQGRVQKFMLTSQVGASVFHSGL